MKKALSALVVIALVSVAAYLVIRQRSGQPSGGELHIYNWSDYTSPELIKKFADTYHVKVTVDTYDTNEQMLAKVQAGDSGYDIVVPTDYMVATMIEKGLLERIEPDRMEHFANVDPSWVHVYWDDGRHYTAPWQWGTTSFSVDGSVYSGDIDTLGILFNPPKELQGRINMLNDENEVMNAALRYLGLPRCNGNPDDLKKVGDLLASARPYWRSISNDTIQKLTSKDIGVSQTWSGAALRARLQRPTLRYAFPREGFPRWMDNVAVLKGARNIDNAKLFLDFIMAPENAAMISAYAKYANGILGSDQYLPADLRKASEVHVPAEAPQPEIVPPCPENVIHLYNQIWADFNK
jgi:spermidine/putrescine transport system substrate-binding protein